MFILITLGFRILPLSFGLLAEVCFHVVYKWVHEVCLSGNMLCSFIFLTPVLNCNEFPGKFVCQNQQDWFHNRADVHHNHPEHTKAPWQIYVIILNVFLCFYAFGRCFFYSNWLTLHSSYNIKPMILYIKPMTLGLLVQLCRATGRTNHIYFITSLISSFHLIFWSADVHTKLMSCC